VIGSGNRKKIQRHYTRLRKLQISISDQEAWNFGFMEMMVLVTLGFSLLITYKTSGTAMLAGNVVGIFFYVNNFAKGLETIPYTVQRLTSLADITRRIELQTEDMPEGDNPDYKPLPGIERPALGELAA
jgi:ABC-type multidrug transport system fused ATPase/permease subunit